MPRMLVLATAWVALVPAWSSGPAFAAEGGGHRGPESVPTAQSEGLRPAQVSSADASADEARALFRRAERSFDVGRFSEALADYKAAYDRKPHPAFLFNMGQCYRNMGSWERARFFFQRYLALDPKAPNRGQVEDLIAEMNRLIQKQGDALTPDRAGAARPGTAPILMLTPPSAPQAAAVASPESRIPPAPAPSPAARPLLRSWWFWGGVGVIAAGAAGLLATRDGHLAAAPMVQAKPPKKDD